MSKPNVARLLAALALAGLTCFAYRGASIDPSGAYLGATIVSTLCLVILGGRSRVLFTAIATVPPFFLLASDNFRLRRPADTFLDTFALTAAGFGIVVAVPLVIAYLVSRFTCRAQRA